MRPPATKGNKKRDKLGDKIGDKTSGRRAQHPTQAHVWGDNGRHGETRPLEGRYHPTQTHMWGDNGKQ